MIIESERNIIRQECDVEWKASPQLRQEFKGDFESFCAYSAATKQGLAAEAITNRVAA